jgi:hypothetical protein
MDWDWRDDFCPDSGRDFCQYTEGDLQRDLEDVWRFDSGEGLQTGLRRDTRCISFGSVQNADLTVMPELTRTSRRCAAARYVLPRFG